MGIRWNEHQYFTQGAQGITAASQILLGPIDVSSFERFSLLMQNNHSAIGVSSIVVQAALKETSANIGLTGAPNWVALPTASVPYPDTLAASASRLTSGVENCHHWIRVLGAHSATAVSDFRVTVGGFTRS